MRKFIFTCLVLGSTSALAQPTGIPEAHARIAADYDTTVAEMIELNEIPAPPLKEKARGDRMLKKFTALGLSDVHMDEVGNIIGTRPGNDRTAKALMVAAHLDTVFPEGTNTRVRREAADDTLHAPGIGDTAVTLAALLSFIRAMDAGKLKTPRDIIFVANVGDEAQGNHRGVRYLFGASPIRTRIGDFISFDGGNVGGVINGAVGNRRYRVIFTGPGGHSFKDSDHANPMVALSGTIAAFYKIAPPSDVKSTYSVTSIMGGNSINEVPNRVAADFDIRSASPANLKAIEAQLLKLIDDNVASENATRSTHLGKISVTSLLIGDRPAGMTPLADPLVTAAVRVLKAAGYPAEVGSTLSDSSTAVGSDVSRSGSNLGASSTDSNIPISLGIPAITLGAGGGSFRAHNLDEYVSVEKTNFVKGITTAFDIVVAAANINR